MGKIKKLYNKYSEIIRYIIFGLITTLVSFSVFAIIMVIGNACFDISADGKDTLKYGIYLSVANIFKWCSGVLVAFFTNKKWVFTEADKNVSTGIQLAIFAGGRVATLIMSLVLQYLLERLFEVVITKDLTIFGLTFTAAAVGTALALVIYSVIEVVINYFFSKWVVFENKDNKKPS